MGRECTSFDSRPLSKEKDALSSVEKAGFVFFLWWSGGLSVDRLWQVYLLPDAAFLVYAILVESVLLV